MTLALNRSCRVTPLFSTIRPSSDACGESQNHGSIACMAKHTDQGLEKALEKPDTFNPPESDNFNKVSRSVEVLFEGVKVLGTDMMLQWQMAEA